MVEEWPTLYFLFLCPLQLTGLGPKKTLMWGEISGLCGFKEQLMEGLLEQSAYCLEKPNVKNDLGQAQLPSVLW